jgi:adenosine kinase
MCSQYVLPKDDAVFIGSIGADSRGKLLTQANEKEGVKNAVHIEEEEETGACAVVIQNNNRCAAVISLRFTPHNIFCIFSV